jgi:DNA-binding phage protein
MPLTREFKETIKARAATDAAFRAALLSEVLDLFLAGDVATGKSVLRDYVNATIGFAGLAEATGVPAKSLMRMVSASGNPRAENLFAIIGALQQATGVQLSVSAAA